MSERPGFAFIYLYDNFRKICKTFRSHCLASILESIKLLLIGVLEAYHSWVHLAPTI